MKKVTFKDWLHCHLGSCAIKLSSKLLFVSWQYFHSFFIIAIFMVYLFVCMCNVDLCKFAWSIWAMLCSCITSPSEGLILRVHINNCLITTVCCWQNLLSFNIFYNRLNFNYYKINYYISLYKDKFKSWLNFPR